MSVKGLTLESASGVALASKEKEEKTKKIQPELVFKIRHKRRFFSCVWR